MDASIDYKRLPNHIAIIMDGNGRWAKTRGLPRLAGHRRGAEAVDEVITAAREIGIRYVTLYAFSMENWNRPSHEIAGLMVLLKDFLVRKRQKLVSNEIRLEAIGDTNRLPSSVLKELEDTMVLTSGLSRMTLTLALSYSGRDEILRAVHRVMKDRASGRLQDDFLSAEQFASFLDTCETPDPDLLIRTSGEARISNFLLWQMAYTEIYFTETLWPDFGRRELLDAITEFQRRERRFGKTSEQLHIAK